MERHVQALFLEKEATMLKKIMVAMDGSEIAERALPWVMQYAAPEKAQVVLFRAVDPEVLGKELLPTEWEEARSYLLRMEKELNYHGIPSKVVVRQGKPAKAIVKAARDEECDLILMTTRGGSPVKRWVMGGVTEQVLRMSGIPVLALRPRTASPKGGHVRRVVVPIDGSKRAEDLLPWAQALAHLLKARLVFLHVFPRGPRGLRGWNEQKFDALRERMNFTVARLKEKGIKASFHLQKGDPADRILEFSSPNDLIVTSTHGFGGFKRWIFGSVAEKLIHESRIPVLVYKTMAQVKGQALEAS
jgi:nucleotide-binding universal stress UspA family protein